MIHRVSTAGMASSITRSILDAQARVQRLSESIADGRAVRRVADDPIRAQAGMLHRSMLRAGDQYLRNIDHARSHLDTADSAISQVQDLLAEVRSLQITGANDTLGADERAAIAAQVDQSLDAMLDLANQKFSGVYLFGGTASLQAPFEEVRDADGRLVAVTQNPSGPNSPVVRQLAPDLSLSIRIPASDVFGEGQELFASLIELRDALASNDTAAIQGSAAALESAGDTLITSHTVVGALLQRVEMARTQVENENLSNEASRSQAEDLDTARAILDLNQEQAALEAAVAAAARLLGTSLLDHLG